MKFTYSEPKAVGGAPLRPGFYKAEITDAIEKTSKAGNEMIELGLLVEEPKAYYGSTLRDYIVAGEKTRWKINQVIAAVGMRLEEGESGDLEPKHVVGKTVIIRVEFEPDRKDASKEWPRVKTYLWGDRADEVDLGPDAPDQPAAPAKVVAPVTNTLKEADLELADDDIPF
jgi:hypothetical protein